MTREQEFNESISIARGTMYGLVFSAVIWVASGLTFIGIHNMM